MNFYRGLIVLFITMLPPMDCLSQASYPDLIMEANSQFSNAFEPNNQSADSNLAQASRLYKLAYERKYKNRPLIDIYYYMECEAAIGHKEKAFELLDELLQRGFYRSTLERDTTLDKLRNDDRWSKISILINKNKILANSKYNKPLRNSLEDIFSQDQLYRNELLRLRQQPDKNNNLLESVGDSIMKYDSINIRKVISIIEEHGWPGREVVGDWGDDVMFLVLQHASVDIQEKYLPLIKRAVRNGKTQPANLAYLTDRILIDRGKKQLYGTQADIDTVTRKYYILPVQYPKKLEQMREEMGMISTKKYLEQLNN